MKKTLLGSTACLSLLLASGCEIGDTHFEIPTVKAAPEVHQYNVNYNLNVTTSQNAINVTTTIENEKKQPIPLLLEDNKLFSIILKKEDGTILQRKYIIANSRKQIQRQEKVSWDVNLEENMDEKLIVEVKLLLKSNKYQQFQIAEQTKEEPIFVSTKRLEEKKVPYAPRNNLMYIYESGNGKQKYQEKVSFSNDSKIQSFSTLKGVQIYSQEDDGIYYLSSSDPFGDIDGTQFVNREDMNKIIPFPLIEGTSWKVGKLRYSLSNTNINVKTPLGLFKNCIEITESGEKVTRYYYYNKDIGLLKVLKRSNKSISSKTEFQLSDTKEINTTPKDIEENKLNTAKKEDASM